MTSEFPAHFSCNYQGLLNRLKLYGMQPKTIALPTTGNVLVNTVSRLHFDR